MNRKLAPSTDRKARHRFLYEVLGALGDGKIDKREFRRRMDQAGFGDRDVDQFLKDEYPDGICFPD